MPARIQHKGSLLRLTIDRPDARNAIDFEVMDSLESAVEQLYDDESIRAFILTGVGDFFISGGDLRKFHQIKDAESAREMAGRIHVILDKLENAPCWTVSLVNGDAYGGGWEMMLACDFSVASEKALIGFTQGKFYLPPGWGGLTRLVEKVGRSKALVWLAEAAVIDARTAFDCGLIEHCFSHDNLEEQTSRWLARITQNDRMFIHNLKKNALNFSKHRRESIRRELEPFSHFWVHEEHEKRVTKFLEREGE